MTISELGQRPSSPGMTLEILYSEGIDIPSFPPGMQKSQRLVGASIDLFGLILPDADPRWPLAYGFQKQVLENGHTGFNFENAMRAVYLGDPASRRTGYSTTMNPENLRQMCRALQNLSAHVQVVERDRAVKQVLPEGVDIELVLTDRISRGTNSFGITGCPEALYQLRLFDEKKYLARVGFNLHTPTIDGSQTPVISITNVQGVPGGQEGISRFRQKAGISPFNLLVRRVVAMARAQDFDILRVYGLRNPKNETSAPLYNSVFRREGIPRAHFDRPIPMVPCGEQAELAVLFQRRTTTLNGRQALDS